MNQSDLEADAPSAPAELLAGIRAEIPVAFSVIPFGLIFGVIALGAGLPPLFAIAMSPVVFAGSAQFIGAQLIGLGAPAIVIVVTTFVVNLRHALYGFSLAPHLKHLSRGWRWLLAYLLTDEAFAMTIIHYRDHSLYLANKHWFFLGSGLTLWIVWQISTVVGVYLGAQVPAVWSLDFTLALTFIGLVIPTLQDRPSVAAALVAGAVAVATFHFPYKIGLMLASLAGIVAGVWLERRA
ncbi:MAG: AzlC family ABC transporter permease [Chloroflexi bacterium]|nr:AzlC family ABC transporter permease [Chloroflexota bacterium]